MKFNRVLVDTSFLFGICNSADQYHKRSTEVLRALSIRGRQLGLAWPVLYETVNTRFIKDGHLSGFKRFLHQCNTTLIDDMPYREYVRASILNDEKLERSHFSLVDQILCLMMKHSDGARIGGFVAFDEALNAWGYACNVEVLCESKDWVHRGKR